MSVQPLKKMGFWRAQEGVVELTVPMMMLGGAWVGAMSVLKQATTGRGITSLELFALLGACVALTGWVASRQMFMLRRGAPIGMMVLALVYSGAILGFLPGSIQSSFATACEETLGGVIVSTADLDSDELLGAPGEGEVVCQIGGVANNSYLPGTLLRPMWPGKLPAVQWPLLLMVAALSSLGLREQRLRPPGMARKLANLLRFAGAKGHASAGGKVKAKEGKIVACSNATMWGEVCGQIYSADKVWEPGEWCVRCRQPFRRADRLLTFKVVTLFSGDVDVLNGIERTDTVSWGRSEPMTPDARISGLERWVTLGTITVPDVISVAQTLSMVHDMFKVWGAEADERTETAIKLATRKASRISAWVWFGNLAHRLTYARPTRRSLLAIGPNRWRDLITEGGEQLWLQLDIGLLPMELRTAFKKLRADEDLPPDIQNSKVDLWIPVSPPHLPKKQVGLWVPRIEGEALRAWLATEQLREDGDGVGISTPLPYRRYVPREDGEVEEEPRSPRAGTLDFVRFSMARNGIEPVEERSVGDSISEWDWLEWEQVELLRQQCLVLVENPRGRK